GAGGALFSLLAARGGKGGGAGFGRKLTGGENRVALAKAEPAAKFAGTARVLPQRELLDPHRQIAFLQFERNDASVAVRHGAERTGAVMRRTGAPAAMTAVVGGEIAAVRPPPGEANAGMRAGVAARNAVGQRLLERFDHRVDHGRERGRIVAHRSGRIGAEDLAGR